MGELKFVCGLPPSKKHRGPGTTEKLGCGLPHENKNNPLSAHIPKNVWIYICFDLIFTSVGILFASSFLGFVNML
jgi:hypothetical protein